MKLIIFAVLLQSATVFAGVTGAWTGTGDLLNFDGRPYACQSVDLDIEVTATTLHVKKLTYICDDWEFGWGEVGATIQDGQVIYEGVGVGTVIGNKISLLFLDTENKLREMVSFEEVNGVLQLDDELTTLDGSRVYTRLNAELGPINKKGEEKILRP